MAAVSRWQKEPLEVTSLKPKEQSLYPRKWYWQENSCKIPNGKHYDKDKTRFRKRWQKRVGQKIPGKDENTQASLISKVIDQRGLGFADKVTRNSKELQEHQKFSPEEAAAFISGSNVPDHVVTRLTLLVVLTYFVAPQNNLVVCYKFTLLTIKWCFKFLSVHFHFFAIKANKVTLAGHDPRLQGSFFWPQVLSFCWDFFWRGCWDYFIFSILGWPNMFLYFLFNLTWLQIFSAKFFTHKCVKVHVQVWYAIVNWRNLQLTA